MPQFYAEILRSPGPHDNSFRLLASNDPSPSTIAWAKDIGVTATSDGDILTFSGSSPGLGVTWFPGSVSSTTYPYLLVRAKATGGGTLAIAVFISGSVTRSSLGTDHAELRLNNYRGKFFSSVNSWSFGDHLHIYLGQGNEP